MKRASSLLDRSEDLFELIRQRLNTEQLGEAVREPAGLSSLLEEYCSDENEEVRAEVASQIRDYVIECRSTSTLETIFEIARGHSTENP